MAEQEPEYGKLTDHEYDGIREYDNPCPTWWHLIFLGTFLFSVVYFFFFQGSFGWTVAEAYDSAVAENLKLRFADIGELNADEKTLIEYMGKPDWLAIGANVFQTQCKSCHGADGAGLVGPNLTDDNYKNVNDLIDIARVIENGAAAGAMPAWKNRLHPNEVVLVSAYAAKLRGKNLAGLGDAVEKRDGKYKPIPPWPTEADGTGSGLQAPDARLQAPGSGLQTPGSGLQAPGFDEATQVPAAAASTVSTTPPSAEPETKKTDTTEGPVPAPGEVEANQPPPDLPAQEKLKENSELRPNPLRQD